MRRALIIMTLGTPACTSNPRPAPELAPTPEVVLTPGVAPVVVPVAPAVQVEPARPAEAAPPLPPDAVVPPQNVTVVGRRLDHKRGGVQLEIGYPVLRFTPAAAAAKFNAQIAEFVGIDETYTADIVGHHEAECDVSLASPQLLDVECRRMVDTRTRREQAEGTGGAPGDYTRAAFRAWLTPELPPVDILEIVGDPAIAGACATLLATGGYRLGEYGVEWELRFGDTPLDDPPPGCDAFESLAYHAMKPGTPRALAFIAGMLASDDTGTGTGTD